MPKKSPTPQTADWLARFTRELTPEVIQKTRGYADKICGKMHSVEGIVDPAYAEHVVADAIHLTFDGIRVWDPNRRTLHSHLCGVVQSRVSAEVQRRIKRRHIAYHDPDDDNASGVSLVETEMSLRADDERARPEGLLASVQIRHQVYCELRRLAANDTEVLAMLDAFESGNLSEPEVIEHLGWTTARYFNVWRRFDRMRRKLPAELREVALELITRGPTRARLEVH